MSLEYPKITIVTCTLNRAKFLPKAFESVENQTYKNIEHIINDSYSTDGSVEIINEYIKRNKYKYPIKFFQTKPKGIARALNDGLKEASGDLVNFVHSDDYLISDDALERVAKHFKNNPSLDWLVGNLVIERNSKIYVIKLSKLLKLHPRTVINSVSGIHHENTFIKTDYAKKLGGFDEKRTLTVEYRLWLRMSQISEPLAVDENFSVMISHPESASVQSWFTFFRCIGQGAKVMASEKVFPFIGHINGLKNEYSIG